MSFRLWVLTIFAIVTLGGCKIQITVPSGGSVESLSGNYNCAEDDTCTIDVSDFFFDETFTAKPNAGYEFVSWKKVPGGFCGAGPARFESCHLYTSVLEGIPSLEQFLSRDDIFFLEPVFTLISGNTGGNGGGSGNLGSESASICYNADVFAKGFRTDMRYRSVDDQGTLEFQYDNLTNGSGSSGGRSGIKITSNIKGSGAGQSFTARSEIFTEVNSAKQSRTTFAVEIDLLTPQSGEVKTVHTPGILARFNLGKGQSYSQSYNTDVTTNVGGFKITDSTQTDMKTTYLGTESITVPAGTFKTCKFSSSRTVTTQAGPTSDNTTTWFAVGHGQLIKEVSDDTSTTLLSGTVNGKPVK